MASTNPRGATDMAAFEAAVAAVDEGFDDNDVASARRMVAVLRREQAARAGRPLSGVWKNLAGRIERHYPPEAIR